MAEQRKEKKPIHAEIGYERRDINIKKVFYTGVFSVVFLVVIIILLNEYFIITKEDVVYQQTLYPESEKLLQLQAREDSLLNSYGVIDDVNDIYRIPIERAMEKMVEETGKK